MWNGIITGAVAVAIATTAFAQQQVGLLPRNQPFGPEDAATLFTTLQTTLRSQSLTDRIDPAVSIGAERLIQLAGGERIPARLREEAKKSLLR